MRANLFPDFVGPAHRRQGIGMENVPFAGQDFVGEGGGLLGAQERTRQNQRWRDVGGGRALQYLPQAALAFGDECAQVIGLIGMAIFGNAMTEEIEVHE